MGGRAAIGEEPFDRIRIEKDKNKKAIRELSDQVAVLIYAAIVRKWSFPYLRRRYGKLIQGTDLSKTKVSRALDKTAHRVYNSARDADSALKALDAEKTFAPVRKAGLDYCDAKEAEAKDELLDEAMKAPDDPEAEKIGSYKAFMVASRHDDCAEDHEEYQGKVYVKSWALRYGRIRDYCSAKGIKTVEWVIGRPAWLTTRPNCRHFFREFSLNELEASPLNVILDEYGMNRAVGTRGTNQNIRHETRKEWYTIENVERTIMKYEERLKKHRKMAEVYENENVRSAILHDQFMIRKWKAYLRKLKKGA